MPANNHPVKYLHFDSTYRNTSEWPHAGNFVVSVDGNNNNNTPLTSSDTVCSGHVVEHKKWASNAFSLFSVEEPRDTQLWNNALGVSLTMLSAAPSTTNELGILVQLEPNPALPSQKPQFVDNYYRKAPISFMFGGNPYSGVILRSNYLGDSTMEILIGGVSIGGATIAAMIPFTITDPTDIGSRRIFVPNGEDWDAYSKASYCIFNETQNQWRPINNYDPVNHLIEVYTGIAKPNTAQVANDATTQGIIAGTWTNRDTYSIRNNLGKSAPTFNTGIGMPSPLNTTSNNTLWFEPKQCLTQNYFNLGMAASLPGDSIIGSYLQVSPTPGGDIGSAESLVAYEFTLAGGAHSENDITLPVGPNPVWTQEDFYRGMSLSIDLAAAGLQGQVRTITTYNPDTRLLSFRPPLTAAPVATDRVSMHVGASAHFVNGQLVDYVSPNFRNELFLEAGKIIRMKNEDGVLANVGTANTNSLVLSRGMGFPGAQDQQNGAYVNHWISWREGGGCHARLITGSTFDAVTGFTTVTFMRALGSVVTEVELLDGGTLYVDIPPAAAYPTTSTTVSPLGGTGLVVTINSTNGLGTINNTTPPTVSPGNGGRHYSIDDVVTLIAAAGINATVRVSALADLPAGTQWSIHSGIINRTPPEAGPNSAGQGFTQNLNMQPWIAMQHYQDCNTPFTRIGAVATLQSQVCYEVELISLVLPNAPLAVSEGARLAFYPYVFVELSSQGPNGSGPYLIMSNNPNSTFAKFICGMDDVTHPLTSPYIKLDGDGMVQTMNFNQNSNLQLKITVPNGQVVDFILPTTNSPSCPNPLGQISAVFALKRLM